MKLLNHAPAGVIAVPVPVPVPVPVRWFRSGALGWVLIGAGVLVWDLSGPETLSEAFDRSQDHQLSKALVIAGWTVLTLHLFNRLPPRIDPLHLIGMARGHIRNFECCADPWPNDIVE